MRFNILIIYLLLVLSCRAVVSNVVWFNGNEGVSYNVNGEISPVVTNAVNMFSGDMLMVTGNKTVAKANGVIQIYQLDRLTDKEFKALQKLDVPVNGIITKADAFFITVREGKIIVVGSNDRGTAYGVLELSRMAGVSAWVWWGDVVPAHKNMLTVPDNFTTIQFPSVEYRGISVNNDDWNYKNDTKLFELMLRLRGNTLSFSGNNTNKSFGDEAEKYAITLLNIEHNNAIAKEYTPHFAKSRRKKEHLGSVNMVSDDGYGYMQALFVDKQKEHKEGTGVFYHLSYKGIPHDYLWLCTTQPGLIYNQMHAAYSHNARKIWIANVHDPKVAAYDLSLFMDMAWNINSVNNNTIDWHLHNWLAVQFGSEAADKLLPAIREFYRLTDIRKPEFMGWSRVETDSGKYAGGLSPVINGEFNTLEFGNELQRYIVDYQNIKDIVANVEKIIRPELKDAYFAAVKYPVFAASAMAVKQLGAQEARELTRAGAFHNDEDALAAAVMSTQAYKEIRQLTDYYNNKMTDGKWKGSMDMAPYGLPVFAPPVLPDKLTPAEIDKYSNQALADYDFTNDGCIVRNASDFDKSRHTVEPIQMLGHSMNAVTMDKNAILSYQFNAERSGNALLYVALVPAPTADGENIRFSVSMDGSELMVIGIEEAEGSEAWKKSVLRGQMVSKFEVNVPAGQHTLVIKALTDCIILDQWMLDFDLNREFYMFPIKPSMRYETKN